MSDRAAVKNGQTQPGWGSRLAATLFLAAFFGGIPTWSFAHQRGALRLTLRRASASQPFVVDLEQRHPFSTERRSVTLRAASATTHSSTGRGGSVAVLSLTTAEGARVELRRETLTFHQTSRETEALAEVARRINELRDSSESRASIEMPPESGYAFSAALAALFTSIGAALGLFGGRERASQPSRR